MQNIKENVATSAPLLKLLKSKQRLRLDYFNRCLKYKQELPIKMVKTCFANARFQQHNFFINNVLLR
jgi:hypothetical protein